MEVLMIPSALMVSNEIQKKFGKVPPALVPLPNGNMLENILQYYEGYVDKVYIITYDAHDKISEFIKIKNLQVEQVILDKISTLGYTIKTGLETILQREKDVDHVYINFADTLLYNDNHQFLEKQISLDNLVFYDKTDDLTTWTTFQTNKSGQVTYISDKDNGYCGTRDISRPLHDFFIGIFKISNPALLCKLIEKNEKNTHGVDNFYIGIKEYTNLNLIDFVLNKEWYDVGHSDSYIEARTGVAARAFNEIDIDSKRGILKKSSKNKEKLINEIKWYLKLPNKLQYLAPRIYNYSLDFTNPYVEMEFYGYHTLHESFVSSELTIEKWAKIFSRIKFVISEMEKYSVKSDSKTVYSTLNYIYYEKVIERLKKLQKQDNFKLDFSKPIIINNKKYLSINQYLEKLRTLVNDILIKPFNNIFTIIHGDLCFANILVEDNFNFMRVIDPRGSFGIYDIYGDPRYELAKLLHSVEGGYDYIIEDLFTLNLSADNEIYLRMLKRNKKIESLFKTIFMDNDLGYLNTIRLIEATLFLSMVPLHSDYVKRQYAMLSTGIILLDNVIQYNAQSNS